MTRLSEIGHANIPGAKRHVMLAEFSVIAALQKNLHEVMIDAVPGDFPLRAENGYGGR